METETSKSDATIVKIVKQLCVSFTGLRDGELKVFVSQADTFSLSPLTCSLRSATWRLFIIVAYLILHFKKFSLAYDNALSVT